MLNPKSFGFCLNPNFTFELWSAAQSKNELAPTGWGIIAFSLVCPSLNNSGLRISPTTLPCRAV